MIDKTLTVTTCLIPGDIDACMPQRLQVVLTSRDDYGNDELIGSSVFPLGCAEYHSVDGYKENTLIECDLYTTDPQVGMHVSDAENGTPGLQPGNNSPMYVNWEDLTP
jgi:hypothetical protein